MVLDSLVDEITKEVECLDSAAKLDYVQQVALQLDPYGQVQGTIRDAMCSEVKVHAVLDLVADYLENLGDPTLAQEVRNYRPIDDSWLYKKK